MNLAQFTQTYGQLNDAVIQGIHYSFANGKKITVTIHCLNLEQGNTWEEIELVFEPVKAFIFKELNTTNQVISEAWVKPIDGLIYFDFSPWCDDPGSREDFLKSDFLVVSERFWVKSSRPV